MYLSHLHPWIKWPPKLPWVVTSTTIDVSTSNSSCYWARRTWLTHLLMMQQLPPACLFFQDIFNPTSFHITHHHSSPVPITSHTTHHLEEWRWSINCRKKERYCLNLTLISSTFQETLAAISTPFYSGGLLT
jgi:hypothetical protein